MGLLIAAARRQMKRVVEERVRPHGLTPQQFWLLVNIDEAEGPSLGEMAHRLRMDAPSASRAVAKLLRSKLVKTQGDRGDRRRLRLWLTPAGKAKIGDLRALAAELRGGTVHGLTRNEEETLRVLLRKIVLNLDAMVNE
ncbi:MAG TPA: MarR family winged helix-turn-helix transcriptional regulator [Myxococcales bacterium]|nr:MarR family winged helix-turn-helix transcriptional regulator [Myxococcales bacterium]